ncbi:MAG: hypothetical protein QXT13_09870 [Pyrobaculum sp.]
MQIAPLAIALDNYDVDKLLAIATELLDMFKTDTKLFEFFNTALEAINKTVENNAENCVKNNIVYIINNKGVVDIANAIRRRLDMFHIAK